MKLLLVTESIGGRWLPKNDIHWPRPRSDTIAVKKILASRITHRTNQLEKVGIDTDILIDRHVLYGHVLYDVRAFAAGVPCDEMA